MKTLGSPLTLSQQNRLANSLPIGILVMDLNYQITFYNKALLKIIKSNEISHQNVHLQNLISEVKIYSSQELKSFSFSIHSESHVQTNVKANVSSEEIILILEQTNISEDVEVESVQAILEGQENERRRIGREIHDGLGPLMSYLKFSFETIVEEMNGKDASQPELFKSISETIDIVSDDLRSLSHRLVPRTLDEFGLFSAFSNLICKLNESKKVNIEFYTNIENEIRFENDIELNIYRCAQELLNNAIKYAKSSHILAQIILHTQSIILMVEDDGIGFDTTILNTNNHGIGLTNIETRVKLLEGEFNIDSVLGKGTVVSVEIPLKR